MTRDSYVLSAPAFGECLHIESDSPVAARTLTLVPNQTSRQGTQSSVFPLGMPWEKKNQG